MSGSIEDPGDLEGSRSAPQVETITFLSPWPRWCPWLVLSVGVAIGPLVGFSPWLFLGVGFICLLSGCWGRA